eukprot:8876909-Pyramimonas_sp.AAC.1
MVSTWPTVQDGPQGTRDGPNGPHEGPKRAPTGKHHCCLKCNFKGRSCSHLFWPPAAQDGPRGPQDRPTTAKDAHRSAQLGAKTAYEVPQDGARYSKRGPGIGKRISLRPSLQGLPSRPPAVHQ